jgi:glycosyltransferase involved in cell wall biosynthesis
MNDEQDTGAGPTACVVVPAYNEGKRIAEVVARIRRHVPLVIVVDDGSRDDTAGEAEKAGAVVLRHERNQGKGVALQSGFHRAMEEECEVVITMDADGQHDPDELPKFLEAYRRTGIPVLLGNRMAHLELMPLIRCWTNRAMSIIISRVMKQYVPDTQCGYRLFRRDVLPFLNADAHRFAAESEMLLNLADRGFRIDSVRISAIYRDERSKIRPVRDTIRFFHMLYHYRRNRRSVAGFT